MAVFKVTLLFNHATNLDFPNASRHRVGGWSESWYLVANNFSQIMAILTGGTPGAGGVGMGLARAALLPNGAAIIGVRAQSVLPAGGSVTQSVNWPGSAGPADIPQMAALASMPAISLNNVRHFTVRGIPDAYVTEGEDNFVAPYNGLWVAFLNSLATWQFRGRDLSVLPQKVLNIDTTGLVTTEQPPTSVVNDIVRVLKSKSLVLNRFVGGRFVVSAVGPGNTIKLTGWAGGVTTGGNVRKDGIVYPVCDTKNAGLTRIVTRKIGRPFGLYRGRRSARKN